MKISIHSSGYNLAGNLFVALEPKDLAFLFIQGWTGRQNIGAAQRLADLGFTSLTYDMRGNGESEGELAEFTRGDFLNDTVALYDFLRAKVDPGLRLGVVGSSFGAYTAALLTEERDVHCLSLRVPASYPDEGFEKPQLAQIFSEELTEWRKRRLNYNENRAFRALHDFTGWVQIIEADEDEVVPRQSPQNYANTVADKDKLDYEVMHGAPHRLATPELQTEYEGLLSDWVERLLARNLT